MQKNNFYISFGVWLFVLPFLGIPDAWKNFFVALSGIFLIIIITGPTVLKKLQTKPRSRKKQNKNDSLEQNLKTDFSIPDEQNLNIKNELDGETKAEIEKEKEV